MDAIATFDAQIHVPSIAKLRHVDLVLRQVGLFDDEQAHERAMELLHQAQLNESGKLLIGIKRLLAVAEMAKQVSVGTDHVMVGLWLTNHTSGPKSCREVCDDACKLAVDSSRHVALRLFVK